MVRAKIDNTSHGTIKESKYIYEDFKKRIWYAYNDGIFPKIDIIPIEGTNFRQFIFAIPINKFTLKQSIDSKTGLIKKQFKNPNLYPLWKLYFSNETYGKDTLNIYKYLKLLINTAK